MEISFQLDSDGRTTFPHSESKISDNHRLLDYSFKVVNTGLAKDHNATNDTSQERIIDDLIFDCEILDFAILPRTFWIPATGKVYYKTN